jgi:hypothetical protein
VVAFVAYLAGARFEYQPEHPLQKGFRGFRQFLRQMLGAYLHYGTIAGFQTISKSLFVISPAILQHMASFNEPQLTGELSG